MFMLTLCFYRLCFSIEREEVESASLRPEDECFDRLTKGNQREGGLTDDLEATIPSLTISSFSPPFCQCKMPETESEWDPESLEQNLPAEAGLWPLDFCLMHLALKFFITLYKVRKKAKKCFLQISVYS